MTAQLWVSRTGEYPFPGKVKAVSVPDRPFLLKPHGGIWTCDALPDGDSYTSEWVAWYARRGVAFSANKYLLTPDPAAEAALYVVNDSVTAWRVVQEWGVFGYGGPRPTALRWPSMHAAGITGVRVERGVIYSALSDVDCIPFYGWDVPSTCWFGWYFTDVVRV